MPRDDARLVHRLRVVSGQHLRRLLHQHAELFAEVVRVEAYAGTCPRRVTHAAWTRLWHVLGQLVRLPAQSITTTVLYVRLPSAPQFAMLHARFASAA